jgi:hypothetical protein
MYWIRGSLMQNYMDSALDPGGQFHIYESTRSGYGTLHMRLMNLRIIVKDTNWIISIYSLFNRRQPTCMSSLC